MSAFAVVAELQNELGTKSRKAVITATGPSSYDTHGSTIDLSALTGGGFTKVHGVTRVGVAAHGNDKYLMSFVPGSSYDPATGKLKVRNALTVTTGTPGSLDEVASTTDLSGVTFILEVIGT